MSTTPRYNPMQLLHLLLDRATPKTFERALVRARASIHILYSEWTPGAKGAFGTLEARVTGSSAPFYRIKIDFDKRTWSCTCPSVARWRRQGACCKHVAALAIAMLRDPSLCPVEEARYWPRAHTDRVHEHVADKLEGVIWHREVPRDHMLVRGTIVSSTARAIGVRVSCDPELLWIPRRFAVALRCVHTRNALRVHLAVPSWWCERSCRDSRTSRERGRAR